jgi:hypothetical protein
MEVQNIVVTPTSSLPVAIVGAGPYGLSVGAHIGASGIEFRIFGDPMSNWRFRMPRGMLLKSEPFASNLIEPRSGHTLERYCQEQGLPYQHLGLPVPVETFAGYGMWFQQELVPQVEATDVTGVDHVDGAFRLELATGEVVQAERVVMAVGISHFSHKPVQLDRLPGNLVTHSSNHLDLGRFRGRDVTVIGAGQSALETAALLHEHGAETRVLARAKSIVWNPTPTTGPRSRVQRVRRPQAGLGPGWRAWFYSDAPMAFRHLPADVRIQRVRRVLGPAGAWWLRDRVEGRIPVIVGQSLRAAEPEGDGVRLRLVAEEGHRRDLWTEHVVAATGYRADVDALSFLSASLRGRIRRVAAAPALSRHFESSVPGLYFVGLAAANTFGPAQRFVYGSGFTAGRLSRHLAAVGRTGPRHSGSLSARRSVRQ